MNNVSTEIENRNSDFLLLEKFSILCMIFVCFVLPTLLKCLQPVFLWLFCSNKPPLCLLEITLSKEESFFFSMMWIYIGVLLLWMGHVESQFVQYSTAEFSHKLDTGKIMLVFFQRQGVSLVFTEELAGKFLCN